MDVDKRVQKIKCITLILTVALVAPVWSEEGIVEKIERPLSQSVTTRQQSQKELDDWEKERIRLQASLERLTRKNDTLILKDRAQKKQVAEREALNASLLAREREHRKIAQELVPFLETLYDRISQWIASDIPFLAEERKGRLDRLSKVLVDREVSAAEKFRKFMETLFIEAEYGNTIEVYQDKIVIDNEDILGDIFRLGRMSLFFLSLDHARPAYYNVAESKWTILDERFAEDIHAAIEMGSKRRPVELLCLPLGKIAAK